MKQPDTLRDIDSYPDVPALSLDAMLDALERKEVVYVQRITQDNTLESGWKVVAATTGGVVTLEKIAGSNIGERIEVRPIDVTLEPVPPHEVTLHGKMLDGLDLGQGFRISAVETGADEASTYVHIDVPTSSQAIFGNTDSVRISVSSLGLMTDPATSELDVNMLLSTLNIIESKPITGTPDVETPSDTLLADTETHMSPIKSTTQALRSVYEHLVESNNEHAFWDAHDLIPADMQESFKDLKKTIYQELSEAYYHAQDTNTNPELIQRVNDLLSLVQKKEQPAQEVFVTTEDGTLEGGWKMAPIIAGSDYVLVYKKDPVTGELLKKQILREKFYADNPHISEEAEEIATPEIPTKEDAEPEAPAEKNEQPANQFEQSIWLKRQKQSTLEAYIKAYEDHYGAKSDSSKFLKEMLSGTGFVKREDTDLSLENAPEGSTGHALLAAKRMYEQAREDYLNNRKRQIELAATRHLERLQNDPEYTSNPQGMTLSKENLYAYTEALTQKYRGLEAVRSQETALHTAQEKAFESKTKRIVAGIAQKWNKLPWYVKVTLSSAAIGAGTAAAIGAIAGTGGMALGGGLVMGRSLLSGAAGVLGNRIGGATGALLGSSGARALLGGLGGVVGGFVGRGVVAGTEMASNTFNRLRGKDPQRMRAKIQDAYNEGVLSYREYTEALADIEQTQKKWETGKTAGMVAGAILGGAATQFSFENNAEPITTTPEPEPAPQPEPIPAIPEPVVEAPAWENVSDLAKVQKGDGVTNILARQINADPELLRAAEQELGMNYNDNRGVFLAKLAQKFGYINESGTADVRLVMNPENAYELSTENSTLVMREWENGTLDRVHGTNTAFQGSINEVQSSREYVYGQTGANTTSSNWGAQSANNYVEGPTSGSIGTLSNNDGFVKGPTSGSIGNFSTEGLVAGPTSGSIGANMTFENGPDLKTNPADILNTANEQSADTYTAKAIEARDQYFTEKNKGWVLEDGRRIIYERDLAPLSAKEVFMHMSGYEQGTFAIKDKKFEALIPFMSSIYHQVDAQGVDWKSWPDTLTFDEATLIAAGKPFESTPETPQFFAQGPVFENYNYDKVFALVNGSDRFTPDQSTASLAYLNRVFGPERFAQFMTVPYGQLEGIITSAPFAKSQQTLFKEVIEKIIASSGTVASAEKPIGALLNTSLAQMGSTYSTQDILVYNTQ